MPVVANLGVGVKGIVLSVPLSLSKPLRCFSPETPDPQAQLLLRLLQELSVPWGTPLTAHQDTWEGQLDRGKEGMSKAGAQVLTGVSHFIPSVGWCCLVMGTEG